MVELLITLILIGVLLYLVALIPMDARILTVIRVVVILFVVIWILRLLGLDVPLTRLR